MKKFLFILLLAVLSFSFLKVSAYDLKKDEKIYVSGQTIGIKLETGVTVMGTYGVANNNGVATPWKDCDIKEGDIISRFNGSEITNIKALLRVLANCKGEESSITIIRKGQVINGRIKPAIKENDTYSLGLYIKDNITGIGTLTFVVPQTNQYGSLGHSITDAKSYGGNIYKAEVNEIIKPTKKAAGEKRATIVGDKCGDILENTNVGVYGNVNENYDFNGLELMNIATRGEIKKSKAQIITCIDGESIETFDIEIIELKNQQTKDIKGIKFRVTDKKLLNKCGGIVQGMSGSPIVQNGKIIGAVTHVSLNDATIGYGVYVEFMLEEMDIYIVD